MTVLPRALLPIVFATACAAHSQVDESQPAPVTRAALSVASIQLVHVIGGWGSGATYSLEVARDGSARYDGGVRAPIAGRYEARMDTATVIQLFAMAVQPGRLERQTAVCYDLPTTTIVIKFRDGEQASFGADCDPPPANVRFAAKLEGLFSALAWYPVKRAT